MQLSTQFIDQLCHPISCSILYFILLTVLYNPVMNPPSFLLKFELHLLVYIIIFIQYRTVLINYVNFTRIIKHRWILINLRFVSNTRRILYLHGNTNIIILIYTVRKFLNQMSTSISSTKHCGSLLQNFRILNWHRPLIWILLVKRWAISLCSRKQISIHLFLLIMSIVELLAKVYLYERLL